MKNKELNISWLYPDILNLHGDRGNIMAIENVGKKLGLDVNIKRIDSYNQEIDFENTDIILLNPGEVKVLPKIIEALKKQNDEMKQYIESNKVLVVIGTTGAVFGKKIEFLNESEIEGLNYLNMDAKQRKDVYGNDIYFKLKEDENIEIVGSQIQLMDFYTDSESTLGNVEYGRGNNDDKTEGAVYKNLIFTNTLGPVFVKNPWFAEKLIRQAMENKKVNIKEEKLEYELEKKSLEAIKNFINRKGE